MEIIKIKDKDQLNNFTGGLGHSQFLQSFEWGEFQEIFGSNIFRLAAQEDGEIAAAATLIRKPLPVGRGYFYCPRGPVGRPDAVEAIIKNAREIAGREKIIFFRVEPADKINFGLPAIKTIDIQPAKTIIFDLSRTEDELLAGMRQKTRYNIRLSEKKEVKVSEAMTGDFEVFWKLMQTTNKRDGFRLHNKNYYRSMVDSAPFIKLFLAKYRGVAVSAGIFSFFGDTAVYLHGASSNEHRDVMAPYALQWHCIKLAQSMGLKYYDFCGVDEKKWPGVTRFKRGFGGEEILYPGTFDLILNSFWYKAYRIARAIRRKI